MPLGIDNQCKGQLQLTIIDPQPTQPQHQVGDHQHISWVGLVVSAQNTDSSIMLVCSVNSSCCQLQLPKGCCRSADLQVVVLFINTIVSLFSDPLGLRPWIRIAIHKQRNTP